ncbi:MAG TPA: EAL domain-containing protein, partial [Aestuariivirga sp.]|nr:EAL domain-containing protein [Aestuariivirga sp.]
FMVVSSVVAVAAILFALFAGTGQNVAAIAAVLAVALGQLVAAILIWQRREEDDRRLRRLVGEIKKLSGTAVENHDRLAQAEQRSEEALRRADRSERSLARGIGEIKERYEDLVHFLSQDVVNSAAPPPAPVMAMAPPMTMAPQLQMPPPAPLAAPAVPPPAAVLPPLTAEPRLTTPPPRRESLHLALEPVVDVHTGETAHYRAQLVMVDELGEEVGHARIMANADGTALRPGLDVFAAREALTLLPRLMERNPALRIFVPLGVSTLMDGAALNRIIAAVTDAGAAGRNLILELAHTDLTKLSEAGIAGVAMLARRKIALAVTGAVVDGIDLSSLRDLGVTYLGLTPDTIDHQDNLDQDLLSFCRLVRALQIQLMVNGITRMDTAKALAGVARFASGPLYAPPRRVKSREERDAEVIPLRAVA